VYVVTGIGRYAVPAASSSVDLKNWTTVSGGAYEYWTVNNGVITLGQIASTPAICGPTLVISRTSGSVAVNGKFNLTFTFNEDVTGFDVSDISVTNGTTSNFVAVNAKIYTADVALSALGNIIISVSANKAISISGINSLASNDFYVYTPSIVISRTSGTATVTTKFNVTFTFSEDVTGFDLSDISLTNGTKSNFLATNAKIILLI
jgi:hypothetical protein